MQKLTTPNEFRNLLSVTPAAASLGTAIETGLLWMLAEQPLSAREIVARLDIPGKRGYYWLQYLESFGVLDGNAAGYSPSSAVRQAFLETYSQETWQHLVMDERERLAATATMYPHFTTPGSIYTAQALPAPQSYVDKMRADPARARDFCRMLYEVHQDLANTVAERLSMNGEQRLLDVGGGSGVISMALLRKHPALTAMVLDIPNVCIAGRQIAAEQGLADRISYYPVEFETSEFPTGFDIAIKCDVCFYTVDLFRKIYNSLKPGGRLVFAEHISPDEYSSPVTRVEWGFLDTLHDPDSSVPTLAQLRDMLAQAGFSIQPDYQIIRRGMYLFEVWK